MQETNLPEEETKLIHKLSHNIEKLAAHMERASFHEYAGMFRHPIKFIFFNFAAGIARGFGLAVGMSLLVALVLYLLAKMIDLPFIGYHIAQIVATVNQYLAEGKALLK
ncbi:MAG: DUF5665 domain-containing protein [Candidatus Margulisiibacteriota bacterium]